MKKNILVLVIVLPLLSCKTADISPSLSERETNSEKAQRIAQENIITDGHVDLPYRLKVQNFQLTKEYLGIPIQTDQGDFDHVRAQQGGLDAPFMSIYLPATLQSESGASKRLADSLISMVEGIAAAHPDKFQVAKSASECDRLFEDGLVALPMGMENGSGLEDDLSNVAYFKDRGISYITLTHSKVNLICDSSYDTVRTWNGLSPYGEKVVREMNRVGIMVDISHVSDEAFYDVMELTDVPVIASHSSARRFTPEFERNMSDDMIRRLGENGGVIQINFGSSFLDGDVASQIQSARVEIGKLLAEHGLAYGDEKATELIEQYQKDHPVLLADVKKVADHIDHVVTLVGVDHVGFGSDYDGVGDTLPTGLKDVSDYPNLLKELLDRGYSEEDLIKMCYQNVWRVWNTVESYAAQN
ncbi:MAG: dipeptidase [Bacteroidota bacterium]